MATLRNTKSLPPGDLLGDTAPMADEAIDVSALRRDYTLRGLRRSELLPDPMAQFAAWFADSVAAGLREPNAMALATSDPHGRVTARLVLLKAYDAGGFTFFTNFRSLKAAQIASNPSVALNFPWLELERQVSVTGRAEKLPRDDVQKYFLARPFGSQIGAMVSMQSEVIASRAALEERYAAAAARYAPDSVPVPDDWGGYLVVPETVEFWQGRTNRLHDRLRYRRAGGEWLIERLSP